MQWFSLQGRFSHLKDWEVRFKISSECTRTPSLPSCWCQALLSEVILDINKQSTASPWADTVTNWETRLRTICFFWVFIHQKMGREICVSALPWEGTSVLGCPCGCSSTGASPGCTAVTLPAQPLFYSVLLSATRKSPKFLTQAEMSLWKPGDSLA